MQGYSFAPPSGPPREGHKSKPVLDQWAYSIRVATDKSNHFPDYVFVDEHNRHKRLKGMRFLSHDAAVSGLESNTVTLSDASLQWLQKAKDQVRRRYNEHMALLCVYPVEISMRASYYWTGFGISKRPSH